MPRYIDADAVIKEIEAAQDSLKSNNDVMWEINKKYYKGLCMAHRIVDEQPTADVAPEVEELIYKLECLLCHATGNRLSKHTYDLRTMESAVNDYVEKCCDEARADLQDALNCQVETNARLSGEYLSLMKESESQKAEIERLSAKIWELKQESLLPGLKDIADITRLQTAREIFGEIEQFFDKFWNDPSYSSGELGYDIAELKKKYTEGENNGNKTGTEI